MNIGGAGGLRRLLSQFAASINAQESPDIALPKVVAEIADTVVADVCSIYLLHLDQDGRQFLELHETHGLNREAVHKTRLAVGSGLVGLIAETGKPLRVKDAQNHPSFEFKPETGEELYASLMGVPIRHHGRVIGVLVVQNKEQHSYTEEESDMLQVVTTALTQMFDASVLATAEDAADSVRAARRPIRVSGQNLSGGIAIGTAVLHRPKLVFSDSISDDAVREQRRLDDAIAASRRQIDEMIDNPELRGGESQDVLQTFAMLARDKGWQRRMKDAVRNGLLAEAAVSQVAQQIRDRFASMPDPYLRARAADIDDLAYRLIAHLQNGNLLPKPELPPDAVLVARDMGPGELLDYDRTQLRAVLLERGAQGSHMSIVARALDIPVMGDCDGVVDEVENGDLIIVDGNHEQVFIRPDDDVVDAFRAIRLEEDEKRAFYRQIRDLPARSADGVDVSLMMNAGLLLDMSRLETTGAAGVGLYRTELNLMNRGKLPGWEAQRDYYQSVLEQSDDKPVVFRTLDAGGDKILPYLRREPEENPALGWRGLRISLDRPGVFRQQLRGLLAASGDRDLHIMFPMVATVDEFRQAQQQLQAELDWMKGRRPVPRNIRTGVMLEVPALAWQLDQLLPLVDFISVGTNDLMQFSFAADRGNRQVGHRYDTLNPGFLGMLKHVIEACDRHGVDMSVCGEIAGRPVEALALIALGCRKLSMRATAIGPVKAAIRQADVAEIRPLVLRHLTGEDVNLRELIGKCAVNQSKHHEIVANG